MKLIITTGSEFEKRLPDGTLESLTVHEMAARAYDCGGVIYCPQQTWQKDFPGQVTAGRIGRPVIRYCPLSWLPFVLGHQVKAIFDNRNVTR